MAVSNKPLGVKKGLNATTRVQPESKVVGVQALVLARVQARVQSRILTWYLGILGFSKSREGKRIDKSPIFQYIYIYI